MTKPLKLISGVLAVLVLLLSLPLSVFAVENEIVLDADRLMYVEVGGEKIYSNRFTLGDGESYNAVYFNDEDYSGLLTTEEKNSIRLATRSGLRFATKLDLALLQKLYALEESGDIESVTLGTLIAPESYIVNDFTVAELAANQKSYLCVNAIRDAYYEFDTDATTTHFVGSIVNLYALNIDRDFAGRGYAKIVLKSGQEIMLYSDVIQVANVQEVAKSVLEMTDYVASLSAEHKAILDTYAAGLAPKVPGEDDCAHQYRLTKHVKPLALKDGYRIYTCTECTRDYREIIPATNSIKVLAIGNSFSQDATDYLWQLCNDAGVENVTVGHLYIGGCSLDRHYDNIQNDASAYTYTKITDGTWQSFGSSSISAALADEEWDILTVQQASSYSGQSEYYTYLDEILQYLTENEPAADIYWHLTWAYQQDSTHSAFSKYEKDQMTMYRAILSAYNEAVVPQAEIDGVIPSGTAVQNLRTSYIGDTLTRDGHHMSYDYGRYLTAMTWYATLTGGSTELVDWIPETYPYVGLDLPAIREAVENALEEPLEVTESSYTSRDRLSDEAYFERLGVDMEDYELLDWHMYVAAFYDSREGIATKATEKNSKYFNCSGLLTREDLPIGTVIIVDEGYQYRPEGWISESSTNTSATRPANVSDPVIYVTAEWWGDFTLRAFNLSQNPNAVMTEADSAHLRIYVPQKTNQDAAAFESNGLDLSDYELLDWDPTVFAYYNSTIKIDRDTTSSNVKKYICSILLGKEDLPEGTVIIVDEGYQYRPEGWINAETKNTSATRPGNVSDLFTVVTAEWWGSFTIRAFNLSKTAGGEVSEFDIGHLRIYVPKAANPDAALFESNGLDIADYELLELDWHTYAFYNSSNSFGINTTNSNAKNYNCTDIFTIEDLPVGTVIIVDEGYQYRPEGWVDGETKNTSATRPGNVSETVTVVTEEWWGEFTLRAFNLTKDPTGSVTETDTVHLRIYVPVNP